METADEGDDTRAADISTSPDTIDFDFPRAKLSLSLQWSIDCVGHVLRSVDAYVPDRKYALPSGVFAAISEGMPGSLPGLPIAIQVGPSVMPAAIQGQVGASWVLHKGISDIITRLSAFALETWIAEGLARVLSAPDPDPEEFERIISIDGPYALAFDKKGLPDKLAKLRSIVHVDDVDALIDLEERILSINRVRNCLEHRGGRVGPADCPASNPNCLTLRWVAIDVTHADTGQTVRVGDYVGTARIQQRAARERIFPVGAGIQLSAQEFAELCWTIQEYANDIGIGLSKRVDADPGLAKYPRNNGLPNHATAQE